jgi:cobalt-zinc-cadmium efflux system outer membrane protein
MGGSKLSARTIVSPGRRRTLPRALLVAGAAFALPACATFDPAQDHVRIEQLLAARGAAGLGWEQNDSSNGAEPISGPLTRETAVKVAMLHSPKLQQVYGELGLARAEVLEAVQVSNPRIGLSSLAAAGAPGSQFIFGIAAPFVDLITLPAKTRLAAIEYERARYEVAAAILGVGLDVEASWYRYVGARQIYEMRSAVAEALGASAELAQRFYDAGNITEIELNREKAAASEARIAAARAAVGAREAELELNLAMGLAGKAARWTAEQSLPLPVEVEDEVATLRRIAETSNLNLLAATRGAEVAGGAARIAKAFRLLGTTDIGFEREREVDDSLIRGPTLDVELPIFNQGGARVARAEAQRRLALARLQLERLAIANGVNAAAERVKVMRDIVTIYRSALVPERETVARGSQLEQNWALIGEFEVLQARAQEYDAYQGMLEAIRDYWLARVELSRLVGSRLPSDSAATSPTPTLHELQGRGRPGEGAAPAHHHRAADPASPDDPPQTGPDGSPRPQPSAQHHHHHHEGGQ